MKFTDYLFTEFSNKSVRTFDDATPGSQEYKNIYKIFTVPFHLLKLEFVVLSVFFDSLLNMVVVFPLRLIISIPQILRKAFKKKALDLRITCDLAHFLIASISSAALAFIATPQIYHMIRGQSSIKLFAVMNMDVTCDKLLKVLGDYLIQSLWQKIENEKSLSKLTFDIAAISLYVFCHSTVIMIMMLTLNSCINAQLVSFLVFMSAIGFLEFKLTVFKKYDERTLQSQTLSDCLEKAQKILLIFVIICYPNSLSEEFTTKCLIIYVWMIFSDSVRHIFIVRLNSLQPQIYIKFIERAKELIYWSKAIEQRHTIEPKKAEYLDIADISIIEAKIPYPTDKVGFRLNCTILPYYCFLLKMIVEIAEKLIDKQYFLYSMVGCSVVLLGCKILSSYIQFCLAENSASFKNFKEEKEHKSVEEKVNGVSHPKEE